MARFPDVSKVNWFDVETGGLPRNRAFDFSLDEFRKWSRLKGKSGLLHPYAQFHANSPLLQLYSSRIPHFAPSVDPGLALRQGDIPLNTLIRPPAVSTIYEYGEPVDLVVQEWAKIKGIESLSQSAAQTEKEAVLAFYQGLDADIAANGKAYLGGWNIGYDLTSVERAVRRYQDLEQYHGKLGALMDAGQLEAVDAFDVFGELILGHAKTDTDFAKKLRMSPTGKIASTVEDLRRVPGWKLENLVNALGGASAFNIPKEAQRFHSAFFDTEVTSQIYGRLHNALGLLQQGEEADIAFSRAGLLGGRGDIASAADLLKAVFKESAFSHRFEQTVAEGARMGEAAISQVKTLSYKPAAIAALTLGAAAVAAGLAFGKRKDRQTQITGLSDLGQAADSRHRLSDFGSGWRGLDDDAPTLSWSRILAATSIYGGYRLANRYRPQNVAKAISWTEERFPHQMLNYFGWGQWQSGYLHPELNWAKSDIVDNGGMLKPAAEHMQRLLGPDLDLATFATEHDGLHFKRTNPWKPYYNLEGTDAWMRFVSTEKGKPGSKWAGASSRYGAPLDAPSRFVPSSTFSGGSWRERWANRWKQHVNGMRPLDSRGGLEVEGRIFQPLFGGRESAPLAGLKQKAGIVALELVEQPQRMFARFGVGLKQGSWNSAESLARGLLTKRVLPVAAGIAALDFADYLSGHRLSSAILGIGPRANMLRAEATDKIPGARGVTDWYEDHVPGPQFAPLALPATGAMLGGMAAWFARVSTSTPPTGLVKNWTKTGAWIGAALMLPFVPGMLGSRKTASELQDIYSGEEPVPVRSGRWWDIGSSSIQGGRVKMFRPHWFARMQARPERVSEWGSEENYWKHNPVLHPLNWLKNPYQEEDATYSSRPYPITSPAGSNIPLIGPLVAATIGKLLKPPRRMHEDEWDGTDYTLFSPRLEPRGPNALAPATPVAEYSSMGEMIRRQGEIAAEFLGLSGFLGKTFWNKFHKDDQWGKQVYLQGSRQLSSISRKYYEQELGALYLPAGDLEEGVGYSEGLRRFVQRDLKTLQANEIPNEYADVSWLPGKGDYFFDFKTGDVATKLPSASSRMPGPGYEALHPELKGVPYEDYPLLHKLSILADVAPYSSQFYGVRARADAETKDNTEDRIQFEKIIERAEAIKKSGEQLGRKRFTLPTERISGAVAKATRSGLELEDGRTVRLSAVGSRAADLSSVVLGEQNGLTRSKVASEVENRQRRLSERMQGLVGKQIEMVVPKGAGQYSNDLQAVVFSDGENINRELIDSGLAREKVDEAGPEYQAMNSVAGNLLGSYAETVSKLPTILDTPIIPGMTAATKFWQNRDALEQYRYNELYGARMQRWETPIKSFMAPWFRDLSYKLTGKAIVPEQVQEKRDLDTLIDQLEYLRSLQGYTNKGRTAVCADVTADANYLKSTLSGRDKYYFDAFLAETDREKRQEILDSVGEDFSQILEGQWVKQEAEARRRRGEQVPPLAQGGRLLKPKETEAYAEASDKGETALDFGDWERSKEIANFFFRRNIRLPESPDSPVFNPDIDYEDVKAKIVEEEGLEMHDYNIFDDRSALLWRKPYLDGAVRELTEGNDKSAEDLRRAVERMILESKDRRVQVRSASGNTLSGRSSLNINIDEQPDGDILADVRRHRDEYQEAAA